MRVQRYLCTTHVPLPSFDHHVLRLTRAVVDCPSLPPSLSPCCTLPHLHSLTAITDLSYDSSTSLMYVLFGEAGQLRAYRLPDWTQAYSWTVPGGDDSYFSTHPSARSVNAFHGVHLLPNNKVALALKTPGKVFRLPLSTTAIDTCS